MSDGSIRVGVHDGVGAYGVYLVLEHDGDIPHKFGRTRDGVLVDAANGRKVGEQMLAETQVYIAMKYKARVTHDEVRAAAWTAAKTLPTYHRRAKRVAAHIDDEFIDRVNRMCEGYTEMRVHDLILAITKKEVLPEVSERRRMEIQIASALMKMGWSKRRTTVAGKRGNWWFRPTVMRGFVDDGRSPNSQWPPERGPHAQPAATTGGGNGTARVIELSKQDDDDGDDFPL